MQRFTVVLVALIHLSAACGCGDPPARTPDPLYLPEDDPRCLSIEVGQGSLILKFDVAAATIGLAEGAIVAGRAGGGYLRGIEEVTLSGHEAVLLTSQATVEQAVIDAHLEEVRLVDEIGGDLDGLVIFDGYTDVAELHVEVAQGELEFAPELTLAAQVAGGRLTRLEYAVRGPLTLELAADVSVSAPFSYWTEQVVASYSTPLVADLGPLPVQGEVVVELVGGIEVVSVNGGELQGSVVVESDVAVGALWDGGQWSEIWTPGSASSSGGDPVWIAAEDLSARVWLRPQITVNLYGVDGPSAGVEPYLGARLVGTGSQEWSVDAGLQGTVRIPMLALSSAAGDFEFDSSDEGDVVAQGDMSSAQYSTVCAGEAFSCGLTGDGAAVCWGDDMHGQASPPDGAFTWLTAGATHACALDDVDEVRCWGRHDAVEPTPTMGRFTQVSAGTNFTCALRDDGTVRCWGANDSGQSAGVGGRFLQVTTGTHHACAVVEAGHVRCWGLDDAGQATPMPVEFAAVAAGRYFTCGLDFGGYVACWGCGLGDPAVCEPPPGVFTQISAGQSHACGVRDDGQVVCWGASEGGQASPPSGAVFEQVSAGGHHSCASSADGSVECWGSDTFGQCSPPHGSTGEAIR